MAGLITHYGSRTKHTLTLGNLSLNSDDPHDSLPARVDVLFQHEGESRVVGSKLVNLTHKPTDEQVECRMPRA